ncbi:Eukaryotic/viral aspartic protease, partial [Phytophthora megakarya]
MLLGHPWARTQGTPERSTSIISLDLARRFKLRVEPRGELLLNGIDGVKLKVKNKCQVKITLGHRVVYTLDVWVRNIGQGIDVFLGMNSESGSATLGNSNFVRPGSYQYEEREFLVYENTRSAAAERRLEAGARELERTAPPMVDRPTYPTPTRVLRRTPETRAGAPGIPEAHPVPRSPEPLGRKQSKKSFPDSPLGSGSKPDGPPTASATAPGADRVMVVSSTTPGCATPGPQVPGCESSDHDAQASSGSEPASAITAPQGPVPESPGDTLDAEPAVYYHQGSDFVLLDMLKNHLPYLPDLSDLRPEVNIEDAIVGEPGESDPEEEERLRAVLRKHRMIFLGEGNALPPPPARGVVCDLDVGD